MSEYQEVPVCVAKFIADTYGKNEVVILCYDRDHEMTHTTTYGKEAFDKENAAAVGRKAAAAIGCDMAAVQTYEDFHEDYDPALFKECLDLLVVISRRQGCTGPQLQQIERILKAKGLAMRSG